MKSKNLLWVNNKNATPEYARECGYPTAIALKRAMAAARERQEVRRERVTAIAPSLRMRYSAKLNNAAGLKVELARSNYRNCSNIIYSEVVGIMSKTMTYLTSTSKQYCDHYSRSTVLLVNPITHRIRVIGGILTAVDRNSGAAAWLVESLGYSARRVDGFIFGDTHIIADSLAIARRRYAVIQEQQDDSARRSGARAAGKLFWVTLRDSRNGGNCSEGSARFIAANNLMNVGAIRSDLLLELARAAGLESFAERAIAQSNRVIN